jgi:hypothetical protein
MELNADFSQRMVVHAARLPWVASPMVGVERRMLDRLGDEVARATSIVRYAPGSLFWPHTRGGGEEFLVLEGVFQDEHGDFPGRQLRAQPADLTPHTRLGTGVTLFVKLWQFDPGDRRHVVINTGVTPYQPVAGRPEVALFPLFCESSRQSCRLISLWPPSLPDKVFPFPGRGGSGRDGHPLQMGTAADRNGVKVVRRFPAILLPGE